MFQFAMLVYQKVCLIFPNHGVIYRGTALAPSCSQVRKDLWYLREGSVVDEYD